MQHREAAVAAVLLLLCSVVCGVRAALPAGAMIGPLDTAGEGCPSNSVQAAFTNDGGSLAIMFSAYTANTDINGVSYSTFDRKTCNVAVTILVPTGYSVQTYSLDFRGSTVVPFNTSSMLHADFMFGASDQTNTLHQVYRAKSDIDYAYSIAEHTDVTGANTVTSPCGQSTILRINSQVVAQAGPLAVEDANIELDSIDLKNRVEVGLKWLACPQLCATADNNCGAHATCFITDTTTNAKTCVCNDGYSMTSGGCVTDPCASKPCGSLPCSVVNDAYSCTCAAGTTYDANTKTCVDINECATNNGGCYSPTGCHNTAGGFSCDPCPIGYQGDGFTCSKTGFQITYNGNGCPSINDPTNQTPGTQTVTATYTDSGSAIALMFSQFALSVGATETARSNKTLHVDCQVAIPVIVPPGYSVTTYALDYRGYAVVPQNSYGRLEMEYFFSGIQGQANSTIFAAGMNDLYATRFPIVGISSQPTSECGQDVILRLSTALVGRRSLKDSDDLLLEVDSADLSRQGQTAYINLTWHVCPVCTNPTINCGSYGTCRQGPTTQVCVCKDGYVKDAATGTCVDINECATNNGGCPTNSVCTNLNPFYSCACPTGYRLNAIKKECVDINECATNNGGCYSGVTCVNTPGGSTCGTCPQNYQGDGKNCQPLTCGTYPADLTTMSQPSCSYTSVPNTCTLTCLPHYTLSGPATVTCVNGQWESSGCVLANECSTNNGGCSTTPLRVCSMTKSGPVCGDCPAGYTNNGNTQCTCTKGCPPVTCPTPSTNAKLSCSAYKYDTTCQLSCDTGYTVQGSAAIKCLSNGTWNTTAGNCVDINECATNNGGCSPKSTCTNTAGGFTCGLCPAGYYDASQSQRQKQGKGVVCLDINECATNNGGCHPLVKCNNFDGGFSCGNCPNGYQGDGKKCGAVNLCATNNGGCDKNAICSNTGKGTVFCRCPDGYVDQSGGSGKTCGWQDPCALKPCETQCQSQSPSQSYSCTPCPLDKGMIDADGGLIGKKCLPATMVKLGTPMVSGTGCPAGTTLKFVGAGPNTWQLVLQFPSNNPFGWNVGQVPSLTKFCQFALPLTYFYKSATHTYNMGDFSYAAVSVLNSTEKITAVVDTYWTGDLSNPFVSFTSTGPINQPNTVNILDSQTHVLSMPASGQEVILRMQLRLYFNQNNQPAPIARNVPLADTKFLLSSVVVGQFVNVVNYNTNY